MRSSQERHQHLIGAVILTVVLILAAVLIAVSGAHAACNGNPSNVTGPNACRNGG